MHKGKLLKATISYFILTMMVAYTWHMVLFHELYVEMGAFTRVEPIMPFGMLAVTVQGLVIAYLYPFWYQGGKPVTSGIKFSLLMGLMVYTVMVFATAAKFKIEPVSTFVLYGTIFQLIQFVVTGAALGLIYGEKE